jgi:hypothetical protein
MYVSMRDANVTSLVNRGVNNGSFTVKVTATRSVITYPYKGYLLYVRYSIYSERMPTGQPTSTPSGRPTGTPSSQPSPIPTRTRHSRPYTNKHAHSSPIHPPNLPSLSQSYGSVFFFLSLFISLFRRHERPVHVPRG